MCTVIKKKQIKQKNPHICYCITFTSIFFLFFGEQQFLVTILGFKAEYIETPQYVQAPSMLS